MGKNHRHKKDLKADKAKVKLKQAKTKFLPKGLNVTNTAFKIKPIVLSQQLKEKDEGVPLSKRKLDVKDLLSRIKHYNENVRHDACEELSEMMKFHSEEIINQHLSQIILGVSSLMQDKERKVRRAAMKVVSTILEVTPDEKLEPFLNYFLTNMRCAMTNINRNIQEDSLMFLDCFLKYDSKLISKNPEKLLPDFFTLISKLRSEFSLNRTLTVNLGSKTTSVTWRIKVLSRLHAVLEKIFSKNDSNSASFNKLDVTVDADSCSSFGLYKVNFGDRLESSNWSVFGPVRSEITSDSVDKNITTLVPLLYETWIEVMPDKKIGKSVSENTSLDAEAAAILSCVMNTLYLLWKYVDKVGNANLTRSVFLSMEGKKFLDHLLVNFPYSQKNGNAKNLKSPAGLKLLEVNSDPKCLKENILICYIYYALNVNFLKRNIKIELEALTTYISKALLIKQFDDQKNTRYLIEFLKLCLSFKTHSWKKPNPNLTTVLENTIGFYNNGALSEKNRLELFGLLSDLADNNLAKKNSHYKAWLSSLASLLCQPRITEKLVNALLDISRRNIAAYHEALLEKLPELLDNLDSLKILPSTGDIVNEDSVRRNIANIFFFVPRLSERHLQAIYDFIAKQGGTKYAFYFDAMLKLRIEFGKNL